LDGSLAYRRDRVIADGVPVVTLAGTSVSEPAGTPMLPVTAQTRVLAS
jgi:hypothetical protein